MQSGGWAEASGTSREGATVLCLQAMGCRDLGTPNSRQSVYQDRRRHSPSARSALQASQPASHHRLGRNRQAQATSETQNQDPTLQALWGWAGI